MEALFNLALLLTYMAAVPLAMTIIYNIVEPAIAYLYNKQHGDK